MVWIPGGTFQMGSDDGLADERPVHLVQLDGFFIDETEVTNDQFTAFVRATGYVTVAERTPTPADFPGVDPATLREDLLVPGSLVLTEVSDDRHEWRYVPGASWRRPGGPGTRLDARGDHPVTHIAFEDAIAYCRWADRSLPTEAQFEFAARGGLDQSIYAWPGDDFAPGGRYQANTWQGEFPVHNTNQDGFPTTSPVRSFPPNGYGLFDMAGNVWEWCADFYRPDAYAERGTNRNPTGPSDSFDPAEPGVPKRVVRGGSFLCSDNYCTGYRPAARMKTSPDTSLFHTGFRTVLNVKG